MKTLEQELQELYLKKQELEIKNTNRSVGAMLSGSIARQYGHAGLPEDKIIFKFS